MRYEPSREQLDEDLARGVCSSRGCSGEVAAVVTYGCVHEHIKTAVPVCTSCRDTFAGGAFRCYCLAIMYLLDEAAA